MARTLLNTDDKIFSLASGRGRAAMAIIRVSGPGVISGIAEVFSRPKALLEAEGHCAVLGRLSHKGELLDQVVLIKFKAPASYTGQDAVDIISHGGPGSIMLIEKALSEIGFRQALPGEFSYRAHLNGKMDLTETEAVNELVNARTEAAHKNALLALTGTLAERLKLIKEKLIYLAACCALGLDYGEDESPDAFFDELPALDKTVVELEELLSTYRLGRVMNGSAMAVLAGATNAGKSSLYNLLLKEEKAIVSEIHGTTRDVLEAELDLDGIPLLLLDTAGLRQTGDEIEAEGVRRSGRKADEADIILYLVDAVAGISEEDAEFVSRYDNIIKIWNKIDVPDLGSVPDGWLPISAKKGQGLDALVMAMKEMLLGDGPLPEAGSFVLTSGRQADILRRTVDALKRAGEGARAGIPLDMIALEVKEAISSLDELSGETRSDEILDVLFSGFCVGK